MAVRKNNPALFLVAPKKVLGYHFVSRINLQEKMRIYADEMIMSGHSKWAQVKHKKGVTDLKRGRVFSKLLAAISAAAKTEQDPDFNPRLRSAIAKAKENKVPAENIMRAVKCAREAGEALEDLIMEAYGPGGAAIIIEAITDSKNRTIHEIKKILSDNQGRWAEPGSVLWAFASTADQRGLDADSHGNWQARFPQTLNSEDKNKLSVLIAALEEHSDVQGVYSNTNF